MWCSLRSTGFSINLPPTITEPASVCLKVQMTLRHWAICLVRIVISLEGPFLPRSRAISELQTSLTSTLGPRCRDARVPPSLGSSVTPTTLRCARASLPRSNASCSSAGSHFSKNAAVNAVLHRRDGFMPVFFPSNVGSRPRCVFQDHRRYRAFCQPTLASLQTNCLKCEWMFYHRAKLGDSVKIMHNCPRVRGSGVE